MLHLNRRLLISRTTCVPSLQKAFAKTLSTRTEFTHRTEENVIRGNKSLEYPVEDCFTFFSQRFEQFGDRIAMVRDFDSFIFADFALFSIEVLNIILFLFVGY